MSVDMVTDGVRAYPGRVRGGGGGGGDGGGGGEEEEEAREVALGAPRLSYFKTSDLSVSPSEAW